MSAVEARSAITVNATPEAVYDRWRDLERLPEFMTHVASVTTAGAGRTHWVVDGPAGTAVEWDAEVTADERGRRLAWRSVGDTAVPNAGSVVLERAPRGQGTEVRVVLTYEPPGGKAGALVAKLFGEEPNQQLADDLRRFKQLVETGEIARSAAAPGGARTADLVGQRGAQ